LCSKLVEARLLLLFIHYVSELPIIAPVKHVSARMTYNATFRYFKILFIIWREGDQFKSIQKVHYITGLPN